MSSMGTLSFQNQKFYFDEPIQAREAGFIRDDLQWSTRSAAKARKLRRFADTSAEKKLKNTFITDIAPPEFIHYPDHLSPRTWQIESAWHALTRTPSYIADEAGLGKTATAIMAINSTPGKTLIVCPPYLRYNWCDELKTWATYNNSDRINPICLIESIEVCTWHSFENVPCPVFILPDSLLTRPGIQSLLRAKAPFKWLVIDEGHRFKTEDAQRTDALLGNENYDGIKDLSERIIFLSGTPMPNGKPIELYAPVSRVAPEAIGHRNIFEYGKTFCAGKRVTRYEGGKAITNWDFEGASNLKQLRRELRTKFMIRHLKKDCLKELGPKTRQLIFLDTPEKILELEKRVLAHHKLSDLMGENSKLGDIAKYRKEIGLSKISGALQYITDLLESSNEKLVVSAYHIDVVENIFAALFKKYDALKIRGGMTANEKSFAVKLFQTKPHHRVIVGNTLSMGLGLTLTKASTLMVVEPEWTSGVNEQMEDRIHRISQDKHVLCKYLVLRGSLDERMLRNALNKEDNIHEVMN